MTPPLAIDWDGRPFAIEHAWIGDEESSRVLVFLHEGLGSIALWRDFPQRLCAAAGARGLLYSRPGYGRSSPIDPQARGPDYLHRQAHEVLPAVLERLGVAGARPWLFGHSDGASIALLHAARFPGADAGLVVMAPHIFVEDVTLEGIERMAEAWELTPMRERLARFHDDPEGVFRSWSDTWRRPEFRAWNIEGEIEAIRCPVLAIQGVDDEYGTLEQVRGIARRVPGTRLLELPQCGHSPQRDQPERVIEATVAFMSEHDFGNQPSERSRR